MINGRKIRQLRVERGLTCSDISTLSRNFNVQVSKSYLQELERGSKLNPSFNVIETIANILMVNIDELRTN